MARASLVVMLWPAMAGVDDWALRIAAEAYTAASLEYEAAKAAADAAYERLEASPDTFEYKADWFRTRRHESEVAWRLKQAEQTYREAGGYVADGDE